MHYLVLLRDFQIKGVTIEVLYGNLEPVLYITPGQFAILVLLRDIPRTNVQPTSVQPEF
jgi:hypothetical protein